VDGRIATTAETPPRPCDTGDPRMNRILTLVAACFAMSPVALAQDRCLGREYGWTRATGSFEYDQARAIGTDSAGNVYIAGSFSDQVDFDPQQDSGSHQKRRSKGHDDAYVLSLDPDGHFRWVGKLGDARNDDALALTLLPEGDVVVGGSFYE